MTDDPVLDAMADAALALAARQDWREVTLRDIAGEAGVGLADAYDQTASKSDVLDALARRFDRAAAQELEHDSAAGLRERVFDAAMARFDAMEPHRAALVSIMKAEREDPGLALRAWRRGSRTARWLLELAGVDAAGARGLARVHGFTAILARTAGAWTKDDGGDLSRTMATLDRQLRDIEDWAGRWHFGSRRRRRDDDEADAAEPEPEDELPGRPAES